MSKKAILFDFDGTLADSFVAISTSTNFVRQKYGLPALPHAEVSLSVGHGIAKLMERLVPTAPSNEEAVHVYREHHENVAIPLTQLLPGVLETVDYLVAKQYSLAVCSNKTVHFTRKLVKHLFPKGQFEIVLGPDDVGKPKPDPAMLLEACKRLNVNVQESVYVGDMHVDVETAKAAGMDIWLVAGGGAGGEASWQTAIAASPTKILQRFDEIKQWL